MEVQVPAEPPHSKYLQSVIIWAHTEYPGDDGIRQATLDHSCERLYREIRQADRICFTGRHPFTTDAYELGYAVGFRQNTSGYQDHDWPNANAPVLFLDNDFRNPDLNDFLELVDRYEPEVAVIGDATTRDDAMQYQQAATEIKETYDTVEPIIVPKCENAFDALEQDTVLGWPNGYADADPFDYSALSDWRGRDVHVLGGMPGSQREVIDLLTQPTLDQLPPSNIVGLDGNGCFKAALYGDYWTPTGYETAETYRDLRATVRRSLAEIKRFWQDHSIWPETEPIEVYGPAVREPDNPLYAVNAAEIISQEQLEASIIAEYEAYGSLAFQNRTERRWFEYQEGISEFWEP